MQAGRPAVPECRGRPGARGRGIIARPVSIPEVALDALERELHAMQPERRGDRLILAPLGLAVSCAAAEDVWTGQPALEIRASHEKKFEAGICDSTPLASGGFEESAARIAALNWHRGVFPVLRALLEDRTRVHGVRRRGFVSGGRRRSTSAWSLLEGPIETTAGALGTHATLLTGMLDPLAPFLSTPRVHWLRLSVIQMPRRAVRVDCRFDNDTWERGVEILREASARWTLGQRYRVRRQFCIFAPEGTP